LKLLFLKRNVRQVFFLFFLLFFSQEEKKKREQSSYESIKHNFYYPPICFPTEWHIFAKQPLEAREKKESKKVAVKKSRVMGRS